MCGSPFIIMSREKRIRLRMLRPHRIGFWLKSPAKKWLTVVELRRGGSTNNNPSEKNHLDAIHRRVRVNRQSLINRFHNENDFSTVMNQTRRGPTVLRFSLGEIKRIPPL